MNRRLLSFTAILAIIALSCGRSPQEKKGTGTISRSHCNR